MTTITIRRSADWIKQRALKTGRDVPGAVEFEIDPADLPHDLREHLYDQALNHYYSTVHQIRITPPDLHSCWGAFTVPIMWDADDYDLPTVILAIRWAIDAAVVRIAEKVALSEAAKAKEAEKDQVIADRNAARELLADEFKPLATQLMREKAHRLTLAQAISSIPGYRSLIPSDQHDQIESASPLYLFDEEEEEEED